MLGSAESEHPRLTDCEIIFEELNECRMCSFYLASELKLSQYCMYIVAFFS